MKALSEGGDNDLKPDIITLTSLRKAWLNRNDVKDAEGYLRQIEKQILNDIAVVRAAKARS
jgi:hypothetical protein